MDLLRQKFDTATLGAMKARKGLHYNMRGGGVDLSGDYKRRLPAWASISIPNTKYPSLASKLGGYTTTYNYNGDNRPNGAILKSLSIKRVTGKAEKMNLTLEIDVEFEVFSYDAFVTYARAYLRREKDRNPITIRWGHGSDFNGRGLVSNKIEGAYIIAGGYSNTDMNTYVCRFNAIGPASAIANLDVLSCDVSYKFPNQKFTYGNSFMHSTENVTSLITKIMYDLQEGGKNRTAQFSDGYEPRSSGMAGGNPVGKIYTTFPGFSKFGSFIMSFFNSKDESTGLASDAHEYVSLQYLVDLINKTIISITNEKCGNKLKFVIAFEDKYPYSYTPTSVIGQKFRSADPVSVLFLGRGSGNYKNNAGQGKDFEVGGSFFQTNCVLGDYVAHRYILISRKAVVDELYTKFKELNTAREESTKNKTNKTDRISDVTYSIKEFFETIFSKIARASGNYVNLSFRLPDPTKINDSLEMQKLIITDALSISGEKVELFEFDPIKGDGNCLSLVVEGKLPTDLVDLALVTGIREGSGTSGKISEDNSYISNVKKEYDSLLEKLTSTDEQIGAYAKMAKKEFSEDSIADACSTLSEFKKVYNAMQVMEGKNLNGKFSFTEYFDLEMKVEMEGTYPIIAGNIFTSTNLPDFARPSNGIGFVVMDVEDKIDATGVWTTSLSTRACPYLDF
jgi:hypothetical protein